MAWPGAGVAVIEGVARTGIWRQFKAFALCVAGSLAVVPALAADRAGSVLLVYTDSDNVTVWKPTAGGSVTLGPATASAHWSTDFISAASVDLISSASPRGYDEIRNEAQAGVGWDFSGGRKIDASYTVSDEPDFRSQNMGLSAAMDLFERRVTGILGVGASMAQVGRAGDADFWRDRDSQDLSLQGSVILAPATVLDVFATSQHINGLQSSPYRFVRLYEPGATQHGTAVAERVPEQRWRNTATVRLRHRLAPSLFALADYRFYADTWGLVAHTVTARTTWTLPGGAFALALEARGHVQGRADFYQRRYAMQPDGPGGPRGPQWRTADKELGPMWTALAGMRLEWTPWRHHDAWHVGLGGDVLHMRYLDSPLITQRTALLTVLDLSWDR